jgi:hypothetical protein
MASDFDRIARRIFQQIVMMMAVPRPTARNKSRGGVNHHGNYPRTSQL